MGIESYLAPDKSLFDDILLPEDIEKDDLVNNIILRSGEFEVLYTNPTFLAEVIRLWFRTHNRTFTKWITALNIEYKPLENYDRIEDWTDNTVETVANTSTAEGSNTTTNLTTDSVSGNTTIESTGSNDTSTTTSRSAYDSNVFVNDTLEEVENDTSNNSTTQSTNNGSSNSTIESSGTNSNTTNQNSNTNIIRTGRAHGNIGVTTSQQMLESELQIAKWNIIEQITDLFVSEFCIMVY